MNLTRRRLLFCAPAVILTPGLLMRVNPAVGAPELLTFHSVPIVIDQLRYEVSLAEIISITFRKHRADIIYNIEHNNALLRRLSGTHNR